MRLEDVAKKARVSISTVSRVVNGVDSVRPSTRKRVLKALQEVNYHPNLQARSLVAGQSNIIGVIVSNLLNPFFVDVFHVLEEDAARNGYELLVANTNYQTARLEAGIRLMLGRRVAGLILVVSEPMPAALDELAEAGIPAVFYDIRAIGERTPNIRFDSARGMTMLVDYLHSLGHRRMAHVGVHQSLQPADERRAAFLETTRRHGIESQLFYVPDRDGFEGGRDAAREILRSGFDPSAILCVNDITAIGVLRELHNQRIAVPGDISVTGFDSIALAEFSYPSLTTIKIPAEKIAHLMFHCALEMRSASGAPTREYLITPELVVRESTGAVPARFKT